MQDERPYHGPGRSGQSADVVAPRHASESWEDKSWKEAALEYRLQRGNRTTIVEIERDRLDLLRRLLDDNVSLTAAYHRIHQQYSEGRAAASTVEALMLQLRERGVAALKEAPALRRLEALSPEQLREVLARLIRLRPEYPKITDELLLLLEDGP